MIEEIFYKVFTFQVLFGIALIFMLFGTWKLFPYMSGRMRTRNELQVTAEGCQKARFQASGFFSVGLLVAFMAMLADSNDISLTPPAFLSFLLLFSFCPGGFFFIIAFTVLKRMCIFRER